MCDPAIDRHCNWSDRVLYYVKRTGTRIVVIAISIGGCLVASLFIVACLLPIIGIIQRESAPRCHSPVGGFSQAKLVGTWVAGDPSRQDMLVIRADGTYKQIVHIEYTKLPPTNYESFWQPWRLEYSKDNIPYLHLTGYAFCGMNAGIPCALRNGGGYDFCQDKSIAMNGEGILVVLEASENKPGGGGQEYSYFLFYPLGSENSYAYELQQP